MVTRKTGHIERTGIWNDRTYGTTGVMERLDNHMERPDIYGTTYTYGTTGMTGKPK
jgi:hypothetical protein